MKSSGRIIRSFVLFASISAFTTTPLYAEVSVLEALGSPEITLLYYDGGVMEDYWGLNWFTGNVSRASSSVTERTLLRFSLNGAKRISFVSNCGDRSPYNLYFCNVILCIDGIETDIRSGLILYNYGEIFHGFAVDGDGEHIIEIKVRWPSLHDASDPVQFRNIEVSPLLQSNDVIAALGSGSSPTTVGIDFFDVAKCVVSNYSHDAVASLYREQEYVTLPSYSASNTFLRVNVTGPGVLSYWTCAGVVLNGSFQGWGEVGGSGGRVCVDGIVYENGMAQWPWHKVSIPIGSGTHSIEWQ